MNTIRVDTLDEARLLVDTGLYKMAGVVHGEKPVLDGRLGRDGDGRDERARDCAP